MSINTKRSPAPKRWGSRFRLALRLSRGQAGVGHVARLARGGLTSDIAPTRGALVGGPEDAREALVGQRTFTDGLEVEAVGLDRLLDRGWLAVHGGGEVHLAVGGALHVAEAPSLSAPGEGHDAVDGHRGGGEAADELLVLVRRHRLPDHLGGGRGDGRGPHHPRSARESEEDEADAQQAEEADAPAPDGRRPPRARRASRGRRGATREGGVRGVLVGFDRHGLLRASSCWRV